MQTAKSKKLVILTFVYLKALLIIGCQPTSQSNEVVDEAVPFQTATVGETREQTEAESTQSTILAGRDTRSDLQPPLINEDEIYEVELREGVVNLDRIQLFDEVTITPKNFCGGESFEPTESEVRRFGQTCHELRIVYESDEPYELDEGTWVFSPKHRIMGQITRVSTAIRDRLIFTIKTGRLDDIFERVHVKVTLPQLVEQGPSFEESESPLQIHRQALTIAGERSFEYDDVFEHNFGYNSNPAIAHAHLNIVGNVKLDAYFGFGVPDNEEYFDVQLDFEANADGGIEFSSSYDQVADTESPAMTFTRPLQMGWVYAEIIFEAKLVASAEFEAQVTASVDWSARQTIRSHSVWTDAEGWSTDTAAEADPVQANAQLTADGGLTLSAGVEVSSSVMVYKLLGAKVAVTPKLEAEAKGSVNAFISTYDETSTEADGCIEVKAAVDLEVSGIVRGLDDFELYEDRLLETPLASAGRCEDNTLPQDQNPPLEGFQFSVASVSGGRCDNFYSGIDPHVLRSKAERCIDNPRCSFSLQSCVERFPGRPQRGVCRVDSGVAEYYYYRDQYKCPDELRPDSGGFAPCYLTRQQEWGDVSWIPGC